MLKTKTATQPGAAYDDDFYLCETGLDLTVFPETPPFALIQVLDEGFLPDAPDPLDA